ncbi:hypothetical protein [Polynucleobacter sp. UK-Kesae-W10]|uniref:hypothetical protein n=1 Tax=Polynucleobacter sp. UK-Kesae-W10 TaxID=1819738 RepID=UPI001C0E5C55|nr:hypothetical protein [Polynucleobacter sp. UK-Kesae-W10]MBU3577886.1 hypothetical protein [Polynucleobacter sp. UK-Kesae-W10]
MPKQFYVGMLLILVGFFTQSFSYAQSAKGEGVTCYKEAIKEPSVFYGNAGDVFTLFDNTTWKVISGGQYEYVPSRYKDVLICPTVEKLIIGNRALAISKSSTH